MLTSRPQLHFKLAWRAFLCVLAASLAFCPAERSRCCAAADPLTIATFSSDVTIPIGHRCMGILKTKAVQIDDPLEAHGFVIRGAGPALVFLALDWCEVRNGAYQQWREALAHAAGTSMDRVLVCSLHQHDAPVVDSGAQAYLDANGLEGELYDTDFHEKCIRGVVAAMEKSLSQARPLTHFGFGEALVEDIASNRRVVYPNGSIRFDRYSSMSSDSSQAKADAGEIDPWLKSLVFFDHSHPVLVLSCYATHPMSHYGKGAVSGDFVAIARRRRQQDTPGTKQIYVTGCSGDVTAGKYNDGSPGMRAVLADRLYKSMKQAMQIATESEHVVGLSSSTIQFRCEPLRLPFHDAEAFQRNQLMRALTDPSLAVEERITAAMGLSSLDRVEADVPIDLPCIDLGKVKLLLLPGESFVRYQLLSQSIGKPSKVIAIGFGECWTGYIPTEDAFQEGFDHGWRWVAPGCEAILRAKLHAVLDPGSDTN